MFNKHFNLQFRIKMCCQTRVKIENWKVRFWRFIFSYLLFLSFINNKKFLDQDKIVLRKMFPEFIKFINKSDNSDVMHCHKSVYLIYSYNENISPIIESPQMCYKLGNLMQSPRDEH